MIRVTAEGNYSADKTSQLEKVIPSSSRGLQELSSLIGYGRPDVSSMTAQAADGLSPDNRLLVAACGPQSMLVDTRKAVQSCTLKGKPDIQLHTEVFGW